MPALLPLLLLCLILPASAQNTPVSVLPADGLEAFSLLGAPQGEMAVVAVKGQPFSRALRLRTVAAPENLEGDGQWAIRVRANPGRAVSKGDTILTTFWMRCANSESGSGASRFVVEQCVAPSAKSVSAPLAAGPSWRRFNVAFTMLDSYQPDGYRMEFWMGYPPQTVEIGGLSVVNYGPNVRFQDLPGYVPYEGRQPDAPWRAAAAQRIERSRKGDLSVLVKDQSGKPVIGAEVRVLMKRHAFPFGSAVAAGALFAQTEDAEKYRQKIRELFNTAVLENDLKWPQWEADRRRALDALRWLRENAIENIRGHNLVWPGWRNMPRDVQALAGDPQALRTRILKHIEEEASATRGQLGDWDVINEPYSNRDVQRILGDAEMAEWFKKAREADPKVLLFVNDYSILTAGGNDFNHQNHYFKTIRLLERLGAPLDGIGMQGHFGSQLTPPERLLEVLDRFARLGKQIKVTEFDIDISDEQLQADYTRDFLTSVFSHPSVTGFLMWGFWEGRHWKPRGAMFRRDWSLKPSAEVFKDLVFRQWWTDVRGVTGEGGVFRVRGFLGRYEIEVRAGDRRKTVETSLGARGQSVAVTLGEAQ